LERETGSFGRLGICEPRIADRREASAQRDRRDTSAAGDLDIAAKAIVVGDQDIARNCRHRLAGTHCDH
jgi:hypothetical protein